MKLSISRAGKKVIWHRIMTSMPFGGNKQKLDDIPLTLLAFQLSSVAGVRVFLSPTFMGGGAEREKDYE